MFVIIAFGSDLKQLVFIASFEPLIPPPAITVSCCIIALSIKSGHSFGRPIGVTPPYSITVKASAVSLGANDILRASNCFRIAPFTSGHVGRKNKAGSIPNPIASFSLKYQTISAYAG